MFMPTGKKIFFLLFSFFVADIVFGQSVTGISNLQCEHLDNPLGIDATKPRFSWIMNDTRNGARQTAYEIVVSTDSIAAATDKGNTWQSGRIKSDDQLVVYNGQSLLPFTKYYW